MPTFTHIFLPWLVIRELERDIADYRTAYHKAIDEKIALRASNERLADRVGVLERRLAPFTTKRKRDARGHFLREVA